MKTIHFIICIIVMPVLVVALISIVGSIPEFFRQAELSGKSKFSSLLATAYRTCYMAIVISVAIIVCYWMYMGEAPIAEVQMLMRPFYDFIFGLGR